MTSHIFERYTCPICGEAATGSDSFPYEVKGVMHDMHFRCLDRMNDAKATAIQMRSRIHFSKDTVITRESVTGAVRMGVKA